MSTKEYKTMSVQDLQTELLALSKEQFNLRMQKASGQLSKPHLINRARKNIARLKTIMNEKEQQV